MKKHRVLIITEDSIFSNGLELLLVLQENLETIGTAPADLPAITAEIKRTQPDVVIINEDLATANPQLVMSLLKAHPDLRVITLSLEGNRINVYDNREVTVTTSDDLVAVITDKK